MSLITAISHSLSGLRAIQAEMQVISSNVTNAQREDYTKKHIILSSNASVAEGTGGVSVVGYGRAEASNVEKLYRESLSNNGLSAAQKDYLDRIQSLLGSDQDSVQLTKAMNEFASAWRNLAVTPEDSTLQQNVIFKGQNLTREVTRLASGLDQIELDVKSDMETATTGLNTALTRIRDINNQIITAGSTGQATVDLKDLRDAEIKKIADLVKITVYEQDQDQISIYTPGGSALLDRSATQFAWDGTNFTIDPGGADAASIITGGRIEGLLGMLDQGTSQATLNNPGKASIYKIEEQLDELVDLFTDTSGTFATAYDDATTATGELDESFFTGSTRYSFAVNSDLTDGTSTVKQDATQDVADDMDLTNRTISVAGLELANASYGSFTDGIIYKQNQNAQQVSDVSAIYSSQTDNYEKRFRDEVGVNVDEEIVRLTQLQNSYSAVGRVISTVQAMLEILDRLV